MPEVAIVVPVYNCKQYLHECLSSIMAQTFLDYIVVMVDDGSTDGSDKICQLFSMQDKRFLYLRQGNQGVSAARNSGLNFIKEKYPDIRYVAFVDSDDLIDSNYLNIMYESLIEKDSKLIFCNYQRFDNLDSKANINKNRSEKEIKEVHAPYDIHDIIDHGAVWASLFSSSLLSSEQGLLRFNTDMTFGEDSLFIYELILRANGYIVTNEVLYFYRMSPESICSVSNFDRRVSDLTTRYEFCKSMLESYENAPKNLDSYLKPIRGYIGYAMMRDAAIRGIITKGAIKKEILKYMRKDAVTVLKSKAIAGRTKLYYLFAIVFPNWYMRKVKSKFVV